jgi:hypothetical protein
MLQVPTATRTAQVRFLTSAAIPKTRNLSPIVRTCALLETASAEFIAAHRKFADAEQAQQDARPAAPAALRSTKRNLADVTCFPLGRPAHIAIMPAEIRREIARLRSNKAKSEHADGVHHIMHSDAGFPLTAKQRAQLKRLEAKLVIAEAFEKKCGAITARLKVDELQTATCKASDKQSMLVAKLARLLARSRDDLLAKIAAYKAECESFHGSEGEVELAHSIVRDVERLAAASTI